MSTDIFAAYMLADAGYDVFMGNARGTASSRQHVRLNWNGRKRKEYWAFSWHEIGYYDLPASIDYILKLTKFEKLNYIGHSQGSISFFVMGSMRPEYNDKIIEANFLAPVASLKGLQNPFYRFFANQYNKLKMIAKIKRMNSIILDNGNLLKMGNFACGNSKKHSTPKLCKLVLFVMNSNQINCVSKIPTICNKMKMVSI